MIGRSISPVLTLEAATDESEPTLPALPLIVELQSTKNEFSRPPGAASRSTSGPLFSSTSGKIVQNYNDNHKEVELQQHPEAAPSIRLKDNKMDSWHCFSHELVPKIELLPLQGEPRREKDKLFIRCFEDAFRLLWDRTNSRTSERPETQRQTPQGISTSASSASEPEPVLVTTTSSDHQNSCRQNGNFHPHDLYPPEDLILEMSQAWVERERQEAFEKAQGHVH
ncbi:unnamed protein product [Amoebophrya sp. A120]|nr:unnamed protein product [Amoebophrya sp. A120]|eukprot:GSA120T00014989001.1